MSSPVLPPTRAPACPSWRRARACRACPNGPASRRSATPRPGCRHRRRSWHRVAGWPPPSGARSWRTFWTPSSRRRRRRRARPTGRGCWARWVRAAARRRRVRAAIRLRARAPPHSRRPRGRPEAPPRVLHQREAGRPPTSSRVPDPARASPRRPADQRNLARRAAWPESARAPAHATPGVPLYSSAQPRESGEPG